MNSELLEARNKLKSKLLNNAYTVIDYCKQEILDIVEIGIFGSLARDDFKCNSDADIYVITKETCPRTIRGDIRCFAEEHHCDVVFFEEAYFNNTDIPLIHYIKRDRRILE